VGCYARDERHVFRGSEPRKQALKTESGKRGFQQKEQNPKGLAGSSQF